jgi:ABC-type glycerol-3-phosphate transport system substrate-binding protein
VTGTQVLCFNKKKVDKVPSNLYELVEFSRRGYSIGILSTFSDSFWGANIFGGAIFNEQGQAILDQGGWANWLKFLKSLRDEPNIILNDDPIALQQAFVDGRLAAIPCWSHTLPGLADQLGSNNLGITLLPGLPERPAAPLLSTLSFVVNPASSLSQQVTAIELAKFFTNVEQQRQWVLRWQASIPTNRRAYIDPRLFPTLGLLQTQSKNAVTFSLEELERLQPVLPVAEQLYDQVMAGSITPTAAAQEITDRLNSTMHHHRNNEY